jgi:hypothetical protein
MSQNSAQTMKTKDIELSILRTELGQEVIPTKGAVDKMPDLVLVSVSTHEGIGGHYISYLIPSTLVLPKVDDRGYISAPTSRVSVTRPTATLWRT